MVLGSRLALHDVEDVEGLCRQVIRQSGLELNFHEDEDLLAFLVATTWELSERYDPALDPNNKGFKLSAIITLKRRTTDWVRAKKGRTVWKFAGRTHTRERPTILSLDVDDPELDRLGESVGGSSVVSDPSGFASDMRVLRARARRPSRRDNEVGTEAA